MGDWLLWLRISAVVVVCSAALWVFAWTAIAAPRRWRYWLQLYREGAWWFQRRKRVEPPFKLWVAKRRKGKTLLVTREAQRLMRETSMRPAGSTFSKYGQVLASWPEGSPCTRIVSNYPIGDLLSGRSAELFTTIEELMGLVADAVELDQRTIVCIDEAQNIFDARDWEKCPRWFKGFLAESGHYKVGILAATQQLSMVEKRFRLLCDEVIRVKPIWDSQKHRIAVFSLSHLDDNEDLAEEEVKEVGAQWLTYVCGSAYAGYSTSALPSDDQVSSVKDVAAIERLIARSRAFVSQPLEVEPSTCSPDTQDEEAA